MSFPHLTKVLVASSLGVWLSASVSQAADSNRKIIAELDPVAPLSATYEEKAAGVTTSKWGALVDFNLGGVVSMGPEFWTGTFVAKGPESPSERYRREDFWPGERHKLDAIRLRWNITKWEQGSSMRGWYLKAGYSYTRINSRANRFDESAGEGDALPANIFGSPNDETDLVSDIRHGVTAGFGNRWLVYNQNISINVGASITSNFKRSISVDSKDPNALADFEAIVADLPDTKMSLRPLPEANIGVGYAW